MQTAALPVLKEMDPLADVADLFMRTRHHGLPVVNAAGELVGILTLADIDQAQAERPGKSLAVGQVCSRDLLVAYPDETLGAALRRMSAREWGSCRSWLATSPVISWACCAEPTWCEHTISPSPAGRPCAMALNGHSWAPWAERAWRKC